MNKILLGFLGVLLLFFTTDDVQADTVFKQEPFQTQSSLVSSPSWETAYAGIQKLYPEQRVYDDFTLNSNYSITGINWWGYYMFPSSPSPAFTLTYYPYNSGDNSLNPPDSGTGINYSSLSITEFGSGVYQYSAVLDTPLNLTENTYWLSIYNDALNSSWGWQRAYPADEGIYGGSIQTYGSIQTGIQSNVAFQLISETPVPITSATWLLGSGLIALVMIRRRTKTT